MGRIVLWVWPIVPLVLVAYALFAPIPIEPTAWTPPPVADLTGVYAKNTHIKDKAVRFAEDVGYGPEDVTVRDGFAYTGLADGRIMKIALDGSSHTPFAKTGGRPLALAFDASGTLIVADAHKGLLSIDSSGAITVLTDSFDGVPMKFVDDLDIAANGTIWFSDASQRFGIRDYMDDMWEGLATGRLFSYDPSDKKVTKHLDGLRFGNGVALAADDSFVLVTETFGRSIRKLWLTGDRAGTSETLVNGLPCYPDNMSRSPRGTFWIACPQPSNPIVNGLMPRPHLRAIVFRLYRIVAPIYPLPRKGWIIEINSDGKVLNSHMDPEGDVYSVITSVNEFDGALFFGSIAHSAIGRMQLP